MDIVRVYKEKTRCLFLLEGKKASILEDLEGNDLEGKK